MKKLLNYCLSISFLGFVFSTAFSQAPDLTKPAPFDPNTKFGKLENGMTYYIKQNKKPENRIELRLAVDAGSICETDQQQGLAHFCEHMCFNGTKNFKKNELINVLEEMGVKFGAELNAFTSFDQTVYMLKVPTDKPELINKGFQVLEDWAHQVSFDNAEIDKERGVIVEEWRLGLGADDRMRKKYIPVLLHGSQYAKRLPIGNVDIIKSFPYDTLKSFYQTWYRPDLMAVVVVGDIDPIVAEQKIKEHFSYKLNITNPKKRLTYEVPGNKEPLVSIVTDKEATRHIAQIIFKHKKKNNATIGDYREDLMANLYAGMFNARLGEIAQKPDAPFMYAGGNYGSFVGKTIDVYSLTVMSKENQIDKSVEIALTENERVRQFGFTDSELERQKKSMLTMYERMAKEASKTESSNYADELVRNYLTNEPVPGIQKEYELVQALLPGIALQDINALAKKWITDENIVGVVMAPEKEGVKVPTEAQIIDLIKSVKNKKLEAFVDKVSSAPLLKDIPTGSKVVKRNENKDFGFTEITLGNGVQVVLKPTDYKNDEILISAYSLGGSSLFLDQDVIQASFTPSIIGMSGLGEFDMIGLQKKLTGINARISPYISDLREGFSGNASPKDLETLLQLNYMYFTKIRKDQSAFEMLISRIKNQYKPIRTTPQAIFNDTVTKIVNMGNPRYFSIPTDAQIDQLNLDKVLKIYQDRFADASDFKYFFVGNFKVDEIIPLLEKYLGGLPSINRKENWKDVTSSFPKGIVDVKIPKNSEKQSNVTMRWKGDFVWNDSERLFFTMLINTLNIKCRESMREDQGGVYGVGINGTPVKFPKPLYSISANWGCNPDNVEKLAQTVIDEMAKIKKDGPTDVDLNKVKETLIREREQQVKENNFWLRAIENSYYLGDSLLTFEQYKKKVESVTKEDIQKVANKYFILDRYVKAALMPAAN